ncbi:MAG: hypothetical protein VB857_17020, partial [Pirellulaceae bacterium]
PQKKSCDWPIVWTCSLTRHVLLERSWHHASWWGFMATPVANASFLKHSQVPWQQVSHSPLGKLPTSASGWQDDRAHGLESH